MKSDNTYTSDLSPNTPKDISIIRSSDNKRIYTDFNINGNIIEIIFKNVITSDYVVNVRI